MIIELVPQVRERNKIWYEVEEGVVKATINGVTDIFDFRDFSDGELLIKDEEGEFLVETVLDQLPILGAKKEDGILTVKLHFSIGIYEQDDRLLFPKPMEMEEFVDLMREIDNRSKSSGDIQDGNEDQHINIEEVDF